MKKRMGFTLMEIVVVLGIVMVLYAIVAPVIFATRIRAKETQCSSNLHQTWLALEQYRQDYGDFPDVPPEQLVPSYITEASVLICPMEFRDLRAIEPELEFSNARVISSYYWPCVPGPTRDEVYQRRGEQMPAVICDVHTNIAAGELFVFVVRMDGGINRVPFKTALKEGNGFDF